MKTSLTKLAALASLTILGCFAAGCTAETKDNEGWGEITSNASTSGVSVYVHDAPPVLREVSAREADRLLAKLFPDGYLKSTSECDANPGGARVAPEVSGKIPGAFTGARRETLYVVHAWDCDASAADGFGTTHFVATGMNTNEIKVLADAEVRGVGASVHRLLDLDGDGQNELVMTQAHSGQGISMETVSIVRFAGSNLAKDPGFSAFREKITAASGLDSPFFVDSCDSGLDNGGTISSAAIYALVSDDEVKFSERRTTTPCPATE